MSAFTTFTSRLPAMLHGDAMRRRRWSWRGVALLVFGGLLIVALIWNSALATTCTTVGVWGLVYVEGSVSPTDSGDQLDSGDTSFESRRGWMREGSVFSALTLNVLASHQFIELRRVEEAP